MAKASRRPGSVSRRAFLKSAMVGATGLLAACSSAPEIGLLCSVPMMKTHTLATVTLGMKNLIGLYPGTVYRTVRAGVHDHAADAGSPGIAAVQRRFARPTIYAWNDIRSAWGVKELD